MNTILKYFDRKWSVIRACDPPLLTLDIPQYHRNIDTPEKQKFTTDRLISLDVLITSTL